MLARLRGTGRTSAATEKLSPTACPGVGYGSWPTISTRTPLERKGEGAQHVRPRGQVPAARRDLRAQELAHLRDLRADGLQRARPALLDEFVQRTRGHDRQHT